jgi:hypothetical protein
MRQQFTYRHSLDTPDGSVGTFLANTAAKAQRRKLQGYVMKESSDAHTVRPSGRAFFFVSWGGMRLSSLGTSATNWPIVQASDHI